MLFFARWMKTQAPIILILLINISNDLRSGGG
jgi:hypothetical protein